MKKILFITSVVFLAISFYSCIEDPEITPGLRGAGKPVIEGGAIEKGITPNSITVSATITKENGSRITERGFFYGTSFPATEENGWRKVYDMSSVIGIGEYTLTISDLDSNVDYYILPYAENDNGLIYGEQVPSMRTAHGLGTVRTIHPIDVRASMVTTGVEVISPGEGKIKTVGVYLFTNKDSAAVRTVSTSDVSDKDSVFLSIDKLTPSTTYYILAFARNEFGEFSGDTLQFYTNDGRVIFDKKIEIVPGYTDVTLTSSVSNGGDETVIIIDRGFCWSDNNQSPTLSDNVIKSGDGTGSFTKTISNLDAETRYFVRAYVTTEWGTEYDRDTSFRTIKDVPTVTTGVVNENDVRSGNANVRGIIESAGREPVELVGICWSTTNSVPTLDDNVLSLSLVGNGFSGQLTGLRGGTVYYVRAYAVNETGIAYADNIERFTTPSIFEMNLAPFPGSGRLPNSTAYFTIGDNLYLLGGDLGAEYTDQLWMYSVSKNDWDPRWSFSGNPAKWQTAVSYGVGAYVFGGFDNSGKKSELYYYDIENNWSHIIENPDSITVYRTAGYSYSNSVFFIGGMSDDNTISKDVWSFHHGMGEWQKRTDFPVEQYGGIAVLIDDVAYVGMGKDASGCNGKLWTTSDAGQTWSTDPIECTIYSNGVLAGVAYDKNIYVIDEDYYILEYNTQTGIWSKKSRLPSGYRGVHCMSVINGKIYIGLGDSTNALIAYDPMWDPSN